MSATETFGSLTHLSRYGFLGVPIFFMISGAVVIRSAINKTPREFLKARALRILPLYYLAILISALLKVIATDETIKSVMRDSLYSALLIVPIGDANWLNPVFWTLSLEVQFYILIMVSVLVLKLARLREHFIPFAFVIVCLIPQVTSIPIISRLQLTAYLPFFMIGVLASTVQSRREKYVAILGVAIFCILGSNSIIRSSDMLGRSTSTILLVVFIAAIFVISAYWIATLRVFQSKSLYVLGLMTYPVYLLHVEPVRIFISYLLNSGVNAVISFSLSFLALISLSYFLTMYFEPLVASMINSKKLRRGFYRLW